MVNLDDRTFEDIKAEALQLIPRYCPEWTNHNESDPGVTLIELFSWMTEMTLYRLNKVPQKNYLAMLELLGFSLQSAKCARTVVRFFPVEKNSLNENVTVKKGTRIFSDFSSGQCICFETEKDLSVRNSKLICCINEDGEKFSHVDFADCIPVDGSGNEKPFALFDAVNCMEHEVYIESDCFKMLSGRNSIMLRFENADEIISVNDEIVNHLCFEAWNGKQWEQLKTNRSVSGYKCRDNVVFVEGPFDIQQTEVNGRRGFFIRGVLTDVPEKKVLCLKNIFIKVIGDSSGFAPDLCFKFDEGIYEAVDLNNEFTLLSESSGLNNIFYSACDCVLKNAGARASIKFEFSSDYAPETDNENVQFAFEYFNGKEWCRLGSEDRFHDETGGFKTEGFVRFVVPADIEKTSVNGEEHFYMRIRVLARDFASGGKYVLTDEGAYVWRFENKLQVPLIHQIRFSYEDDEKSAGEAITFSCFKWNKTVFADENNSDGLCGGRQIFDLNYDSAPALYFGFEKPLLPGDMSIYFKLKGDRNPLEKEDGCYGKRGVCLVWQYFCGGKWKNAVVQDGTDCFHESGFIGFCVDEKIEPAELYGCCLSWMRVVKLNGSFENVPVVEAVVCNGVMAANVMTYENETVGSGNGGPGQKFNCAHKDVLPGMKVYVRQQNVPSADEMKRMRADGIQEPYFVDGENVWVQFREVKDFYSSDSFSRHFVVDHKNGVLLFGDGIHGVCPVKGRNNVLVKEYKCGGGAGGNVASKKLCFLEHGIPYIAGCENVFAAEGGCDMETVEHLKARAPSVFSSFDRCVTASDFEKLCFCASSSVGRAFCSKCVNGENKVQVVVLPLDGSDSSEDSQAYRKKLVPSRELLRVVRNYLEERCVVGTRIIVSGPVYRSFSLTVKVHLNDGAVDVEKYCRDIEKSLRRFFHALSGGNGGGWSFGVGVNEGLVKDCVEKQKNVAYVCSVKIFDEDGKVAVQDLRVDENCLPFLEGVIVEAE